MQEAIIKLTVGMLRRDGGTQTRAQLDAVHLADLVEALADEKAHLPPVDAFHDGREYWLADGFHRVEAYAQAGRDIVPCNVRQGTVRDAILFSVGANADHGKKRTREDVQRAIEKLLTDEEWRARSDRWIAEQCKVDHKTVASARARLAPPSTGEFPGSARDGKDGKTRRMPERKPAVPPPEPEPEDLGEEFDDEETAEDPEPTAPPPLSAPRQRVPEPQTAPDEPPLVSLREPSRADALLSAWEHCNASERAAFLESLGVVSADALEELRAQRESDPEYAQHRRVEQSVAAKLGMNRAQRMIDMVLRGGEIAMVRLGLSYSSTMEQLADVYKRRSLVCHPDRGGSASSMVRLNADRDLIRSLLEASQPTPKSA